MTLTTAVIQAAESLSTSTCTPRRLQRSCSRLLTHVIGHRRTVYKVEWREGSSQPLELRFFVVVVCFLFFRINLQVELAEYSHFPVTASASAAFSHRRICFHFIIRMHDASKWTLILITGAQERKSPQKWSEMENLPIFPPSLF